MLHRVRAKAQRGIANAGSENSHFVTVLSPDMETHRDRSPSAGALAAENGGGSTPTPAIPERDRE
jgi:hypothetical protein